MGNWDSEVYVTEFEMVRVTLNYLVLRVGGTLEEMASKRQVAK